MAHPPGEPLTIASGDLEARFVPRGAELWSLRHEGRDLLWDGDPLWWSYRAPILFPVVGRSRNDQVTLDGLPLPMPSHGFARELPFDLVEHSAGSLLFRQRATSATWTHYPFAYRLEISAVIEAGTLVIETVVANDDQRAMPFSFGYHPAFLWPQPPDAARTRHVCRFARAEPGPVRRAAAATGLLIEAREPSPLEGRTLRLDDALFEHGSLQFEAVESRRVWFGEVGARGLDVGFPDSPQLGIWTKPGAPFLCIEPWQGLAAEEAGSDELALRPGARTLPPGNSARYRLRLTPGTPDPG